MIINRSVAMACACLASAWLAMACGSSNGSGDETAAPEVGSLGLPLSSVSASGVEYRLRDAQFDLVGYPRDCWDGDCEYYTNSLSSEDYLDEPSIVLDLIEGDYEVALRGDWYLERIVDGEATPVEAVLLNDPYQWFWVSPHSTNWVTFHFGIGDEELWLNGQVNIEIEVHEDPDEYYGGGLHCETYCDPYGCWEECCERICDGGECWEECWGSGPLLPMPDGAAGAPNAPAP